jgi:hypothetical protein
LCVSDKIPLDDITLVITHLKIDANEWLFNFIFLDKYFYNYITAKEIVLNPPYSLKLK